VTSQFLLFVFMFFYAEEADFLFYCENKELYKKAQRHGHGDFILPALNVKLTSLCVCEQQ